MAAREGDTPTGLAGTAGSIPKPEVIVIGDVYWDTVVAPVPSEDADPQSTDGRENICARIIRPAGAWQLERFIDLANWGKDFHVSGYRPTPKDGKRAWQEFLKEDEWPRAVTRIQLFPKGISGGTTHQVYRIEHVYGWSASRKPSERDEYEKSYGRGFCNLNENLIYRIGRAKSPYRIVIINDDCQIFRFLVASGNIIETLVRQNNKDWVVFVTTHPFEGPLWDKFAKLGFYNRAVLVISLTALRTCGYNVPQDVAVETKAYTLWRHMRTIPELKKLMKFKHVLIRDNYGVFHFDGGAEKPFHYYFHPFKGGPEYSSRRYGSMSGFEKILVASIVKTELDCCSKCASNLFAKIGDGIRDALNLWTKHFDLGFSSLKFPDEYLNSEIDYENPHPFDHLFSEQNGKKTIDAAKIEIPVAWVRFHYSELERRRYTEERLKRWSRVEWIPDIIGAEKFDRFLVAIVERGLSEAIEKFSTLDGHKFDPSKDKNFCPFAQFGDLEVVDQEEINGLSDIYRMIVKYLEDDNWKLPLSLAVFGPPGAGKSFAVKEILKAARVTTGSKSNDDAPVYNLAQFNELKNLTTAFHQVQDKALSEEVPLISMNSMRNSVIRNTDG